MHLYCILDLGYTPESHAEQVTACLLAGGADILQLRAKGHDLATIRRVAEKLIPLCRAAKVPFILNDHPQLAGELGANGVHIGQDDGSLEAAQAAYQRGVDGSLVDRGILSGPYSFTPPSPESSFSISDLSSAIPNLFSSSPIVGRSTHSLDQARAALAEGFHYIGFGPLFPTPTKAGRPAIGLHDIAAMQRDVGEKIPAFCIGGITPTTLPEVLAAGACRVVVVSALLQASDVEAATIATKLTLTARL